MRFLPSTPVRAAAALAAIAALAGCSFVTGIPSVSRVDVSIAPRVININQGASAIGTAYHGDNVIRNSRRQVTFRSDNDAVATVNPSSGAIIGLSPGVAHITGETGGKSDMDSVIVRLVPARAVLLIPQTPRFRVGATNLVSATVRDSLGNSINNRQVAYTSSDETVLSVGLNTGIVTPRAPGTAQIVATVENGLGGGPNVADTVTATVTLPPITGLQLTPLQVSRVQGETQQYTLALTDSLGAVANGTRTITWNSSDQQVATVDANGLATAVGAGSTTISAVLDRVPGEATRLSNAVTLTVTQIPVASVTVSPSPLNLKRSSPGPTGSIVNLVVRDANGNQLFGRRVRVVSSDNTIATASTELTTSQQITITSRATGTVTFLFQALDSAGQDQGAAFTLTVNVAP